MLVYNDSALNVTGEPPVIFKSFDLMRVGTLLGAVYCLAYGIVFVVGFIGNFFVVAAVVRQSSMRNITNYFITNLAVADLLIIIFCLPATLMNNILNEWHFGDFLCRVSVWLNSVATASSIFTLVAVTGDRFAAIIYTMRYSTWSSNMTLFIIVPIWLFSCAMFLPWIVYTAQEDFYTDPMNVTLEDGSPAVHIYKAQICRLNFPSIDMAKFSILTVVIVAYLIPLIVITVCYVVIFVAIIKRSKRTLAVDQKAAEREHRIRHRVTVMMLIVIIVFACSWAPLYSLYLYMYFGDFNESNDTGQFLVTYLRPVFQWLSICNSCVNPILYACFSLKFREAFKQIILLPCRRQYAIVRQMTTRAYNSARIKSGILKSPTDSSDSAQARNGFELKPRDFRSKSERCLPVNNNNCGNKSSTVRTCVEPVRREAAPEPKGRRLWRSESETKKLLKNSNGRAKKNNVHNKPHNHNNNNNSPTTTMTLAPKKTTETIEPVGTCCQYETGNGHAVAVASKHLATINETSPRTEVVEKIDKIEELVTIGSEVVDGKANGPNYLQHPPMFKTNLLNEFNTPTFV